MSPLATQVRAGDGASVAEEHVVALGDELHGLAAGQAREE